MSKPGAWSAQTDEGHGELHGLKELLYCPLPPVDLVSHVQQLGIKLLQSQYDLSVYRGLLQRVSALAQLPLQPWLAVTRLP